MIFLIIIHPLGWLVGVRCCREFVSLDRGYREDIWYDWFQL